MKKTLELAWGVIRRPAPTFRRIKEEKPLGRGILVALIPLIVIFVISILRGAWIGIEFVTLSVIYTATILILLVYPVIISCTVFFDFTARLLKAKSEYKSLLISNFFIFGVVVSIGYLIITSFHLLIKSGLFISLCKILFSAWAIFLLILTLREIYKFSISKSIAIFSLTFLLILPLFVATIPNLYSTSLPSCITILALLICLIIVLIFKRILLGSLIRKKILYFLSLLGSLSAILLITSYLNVILIPSKIMVRYCTSPQSIAIDDLNNIYVASVFQSGKIFKFNSSGKFLDKFKGNVGYQVIIDYEGMIYLAAPQLRKGSWHLQKFNKEGELISSISLKMKEPTDRDYHNHLKDIGIDGQGNIYILARLEKDKKVEYKVQKFNPEGKLLMEFGKKGKGDGEFYGSWAMTVDKKGNIYVTGLYKIQKFDDTGKFIKVFKSPKEKDSAYLGQLPMDIEVDRDGNIYVLVMDWEIEEERKIRVSKVKKFDSQGNLLMSIGSREREEEDFWFPDGIAVDSKGHIYVADRINHRIQVFDKQGEFLRSIKHNPFMIKWYEESIIGKFFDKMGRPSRVVELKK